MNIQIRQATPDDLDAVTRLEARCFPQAEAAAEASLSQRIGAFPESFFVAETNGEIIGMVNGCVINETAIRDELFENASLHVPEGAYQTIFGLDVLPEYQKQGIGAMLMQHMIKAAREAGRKGVILTCKKKLLLYYEKFGFENRGISLSVHGGATWYDMMLEFEK